MPEIIVAGEWFISLTEYFKSSLASMKIIYQPGAKKNGKITNVIFYLSSPKRRKKSPEPKPTKVHIGKLTRNVNKDHIMEIFSNYGSIKNIDMPMDRVHSNFSKLFAYIEYEMPEEAEKAVKYMDGGN